MIQILLPILAIAAARASRNGSVWGRPIESSPVVRLLFWKFVIIVIALVVAAQCGTPVFRGILIGLVAFCLPTFLLGPVIVWLGRPRIAYYTMRGCLPLHYAGNQYAGAMLYATLSVTRMRDPTAACAWLDERLREKAVAGVLGQTILGHLAAAKGDRVTAQCLFESIDARLTRPRRSIVRVTARDWLVMDAARRGDWFAAVRYTKRGGSTSRWSRAVAGMAQTFTGLAPLPKWRLRLLWWVAPRRRRLRPLLERALAASVRERESDTGPPGDLPAALGRLAEMLAKVARPPGQVSSVEFLAAVRAVTLQLEGAEVKVQVEQRLAALDSTLSHNAGSVFSDFKSDVVELILPVVAAHPEWGAEGRDDAIIAEALRRLQGAAFETIEMRAKDLARRAAQKQSLDALSEWQSWALLCDEANRLLALQPDAKANLFEAVWRPLLNYAVFQHNHLTRHPFAQDIFRWLSAHAQAHGSGNVVVTLDKNIACYQPKD